jgi:hypothetical protein
VGDLQGRDQPPSSGPTDDLAEEIIPASKSKKIEEMTGVLSELN